MTEPRILIISHAHPDLSIGGGEIAAYAHWRELRRRGIEAMFVARAFEEPGHSGAPFSSRSADGRDVLFSVTPVNHFRHSQTQGRIVYHHFRELLETFRPTAVHFHHYVHLGVEFIREVRKFDPDISITMTLHEFLAICHAQGQMVKTSGKLCERAAPLDCHLCFPHISPQEFFMREVFLKSFFDLVDHFVCPSQFLCDRYVAWGLPERKMVVLDNGQPARIEKDLDGESANERKFVVLGQLSQLKGTLLLLKALKLLPGRVLRTISMEIHGSAQYADEAFKAELAHEMKDLKDTVRFCGPYRLAQVSSILRRNGWLIVPSVWWENSPMVIQEAFAAGRPVLCGDVGGMAEKVTHGVDGFHFAVNNSADLASRIAKCARHPEAWKEMCARVPKPLTVEAAVDRLLALYGSRSASEEEAGESGRQSVAVVASAAIQPVPSGAAG